MRLIKYARLKFWWNIYWWRRITMPTIWLRCHGIKHGFTTGQIEYMLQLEGYEVFD